MAWFPTQAITQLEITDEVSVISTSHVEDLYTEQIAVEQHLIDCFSRFRAYRDSSNQVINTTTLTKVQFNAESFDMDGEYDHSSDYDFIPVNSGYYAVTVNITFSTYEVGKYCAVFIYNGASSVSRQLKFASVADQFCLNLNDLLYFSASDVIIVNVYMNCAGAKLILPGTDYTNFSAHRLS